MQAFSCDGTWIDLFSYKCGRDAHSTSGTGTSSFSGSFLTLKKINSLAFLKCLCIVKRYARYTIYKRLFLMSCNSVSQSMLLGALELPETPLGLHEHTISGLHLPPAWFAYLSLLPPLYRALLLPSCSGSSSLVYSTGLGAAPLCV